MSNSFFEGEDKNSDEFKPLMPKYYPEKYQKYVTLEKELLQEKLSGNVLEAGVGIGRMIPLISPHVNELVGVDTAQLMLKKAKEVSKRFANVKIYNIDLEEISSHFDNDYFDYTLCIWNTLGNVKNEVKILEELAKITKHSIFITVYHKGTINERKEWYSSVDIALEKVDKVNELFYTKSGLKSKSYSLEDIRKIAHSSGLIIKEHKILAGVMLWAELVKDNNS